MGELVLKKQTVLTESGPIILKGTDKYFQFLSKIYSHVITIFVLQWHCFYSKTEMDINSYFLCLELSTIQRQKYPIRWKNRVQGYLKGCDYVSIFWRRKSKSTFYKIVFELVCQKFFLNAKNAWISVDMSSISIFIKTILKIAENIENAFSVVIRLLNVSLSRKLKSLHNDDLFERWKIIFNHASITYSRRILNIYNSFIHIDSSI